MDLPYGDTTLHLAPDTLPGATVLRPRPPAALAVDDIPAALRHAVDAPESAPPLSELAARASNACIVVSDKTRNYGQAMLLPPLLNYLNEAGLPDDKITVLIGNGTHENHSQQEKHSLLGSETLRRVRVADHDADDPAANTHIGHTPAGTPVLINKILMDADLKIVTGGVTHHYYAGFSGGRKGIMPGCAARSTIEANHSRVLRPDGAPHPHAATGVLPGNPVHEDMLAAALMVDNVFLLNAVTGAGGAPALLCAGDMEAAHADAVGVARACYEVPIEKPFDLVLTSCGGAPRDISFYQAHKSFNNAFAACRPGGALILLAACPAGLGPAGFEDWFRHGSPAAIADKLRKKYAVPGQTAMATLRKADTVRSILVSNLPDEQVRLMHINPAASLDDALRQVDCKNLSVAIMPQAAYTVPATGA